MSRLRFIPLGSGFLVCPADSGKELGMIDRDVDGFFYWFPEHVPGTSWPSWMLRDIVEKLDALNLPWQQQIDRDLVVPEREP